MIKKRIYTILEVKERELTGKILFAIKMSNLGYSVVIGKNFYTLTKNILNQVYIILKEWEKNIRPMKNLINNGHKIVGFDEEGMVAHEVSLIPNRVNKDCMKMVDFFLQ